MKILVVVSEFPPVRSGVATSAGLLVEHYQILGHEVDAITMRSLPKLIWGELRLSFFFLRWPSIRRKLKTYDVAHLHGPAPSFSDLFLLLMRCTMTRASRPRAVYTHHFELDLPGMGPLCWLYNRWHARVMRLADAVVVTTHAYQQLLLGRGHREAAVIPWGADHRRCPIGHRKANPFEVLAVAQLRPYKGLEVLLRAFRHLPGARLHIVGDGHRRQQYEALAASLGLQNVRFHGNVSDGELCGLYASSHVVVLASVSRMEAFGMSLLEGMVTGCVPVASKLLGVAEVVGDAGKIVQPGNADELAAALRYLQQDRGAWERFSARARERAATFRWEDTARRYVALIGGLRRGPSPRIESDVA